MPGSASRPGRAALFLALILFAILVAVDLSSSHSLLRGMWDAAFPRNAPGERLRGNLMESMKARR